MKRVLLALGVLGAVACGSVKLEDYRRPFACDHKGGDGGIQCSTGWACGFDDRCFDEVLDGGQAVAGWRCEVDGHCPTRWRCGEEVDGQRYCQELGVGAPSRCATDDAGCQGGWRCSVDSRCFDPGVVDGGTGRECTRDGQCPNRFRCGEGVTDASVSHCIEVGVGAPSTCHTDQGCEGSFRCDTFANHCVEVPDVVDSGQHLSGLTVTQISPLIDLPAPLLFAITRVSQVPSQFGGALDSRLSEGVLMAALHPDGVHVSAQLSEDVRQADGGRRQVLFSAIVALPAGSSASDVTQLVSTFEGPVVRFTDAGVARLWLDGGRPPLVAADFIRQVDPLERFGVTQWAGVQGNQVFIGAGSIPFPSTVREVVALRNLVYGLTDTGLFLSVDGGPADPLLADGGRLGPLAAGLSTPSEGVVAGYASQGDPMRRLSIVVQTPRDGGGSEFVGYVPGMMTDWQRLPGLSGCPGGGTPLQVAFDEDSARNPSLLSRCSDGADGGLSLRVRFRTTGQDFSGLVEDQTPFRLPSVVQRSSALTRAHAASWTRAWHVVDLDGWGLMGGPLRPVVLDRQPESVLSFFDTPSNATRIFAQAAGYVFKDDPAGGLVSAIQPQVVVPLAVLPTNGSWIVVTTGIIDLDTSTDGPRLMAVMPPGEVLTSPASAVSARLWLAGALREVILVASGDAIWVADVTDARLSPFAQPAALSRVLVPVSGVRLHSMALEASDAGLSGYLTTSTQNLRFGTSDLVRWSLSPVPVPAPTATQLPLEVWAEGARGRTGFTDGRVWSLPIMVPLTQALASRDGGALMANDYARKCGDLFVATDEGVFRAESTGPDAGLPQWTKVSVLNGALESFTSLRLYETHDSNADRLFVGTQTGQLLELRSATCQ